MSMRQRGFSALPKDTGLYRAQDEKDACGVGFIANFKSKQSSKLVQDALVMLSNMDHRGGCGCEENSGDGAGIMIGMPFNYFRKQAKESFGVKLPRNGDFAVGNVFLAHDVEKRQLYKGLFEKHLAKRKVTFVGWRRAPVDNSMIGRSALLTEPWVEQLFVVNEQGWDTKTFDLMLYMVSQSVRREALSVGETDLVYVCSLSSQTMVFKGQLTSEQVRQYYLDLHSPELESHFALVHSRFSTNTFPSWDRAHPFRLLCHNGEINTLRGNKNQMSAREGQLVSPLLPNAEETKNLLPVCSDDYSDSGNFDAVFELLARASPRSLPEVVMMMLPEAWQNDPNLSPEKKAFYEYNSCHMEPWDGPAMIAFADGRYLGCILDRNGLRPHRYYVTDEMVVAASEVGVIPSLPESSVLEKGRLQPGKMFLVDFERQGIVGDKELKRAIAMQRPYGEWVDGNLVRLSQVARQYPRRAFAPRHSVQIEEEDMESAASQLNNMLNMFGFSVETLDILLPPMVDEKKEALGSMGVDTPLACLSNEARSIYDYFKQLFAQVTNPPMDSIREEVVMAMNCPIGPMQNILEVSPSAAQRLEVDNPILTSREAECIVRLRSNNWRTVQLDATYPRGEAPGALDAALTRLCDSASKEIAKGNVTCLFITDRKAGPDDLPIPSLLALGAVHQHLLATKERTRVALVVESGDAREVHHYCCLVGFGADAVYPYMAYEAISHLFRLGKVTVPKSVDECVERYINACGKGIRKVMGKIGISTVQSYKGAQIFEAVGIGAELIERCFAGTASRLAGIDLSTIERDMAAQHEKAWPRATADSLPGPTLLHNPGEFHYRDGGEAHFNDPKTIVGIQEVARNGNKEAYFQYAEHANEQAGKCTLRGLLEFRKADVAVPLDQVEPAKEIVKRFVTGAMSLGSISKEAHETLALAMNSIGGKSNTGEGGEDPERFSWIGPNGESKRSAIKQVASGRFGVTSEYLADADEIQIKMAQGAKPGEGGELPGKKVFGMIAKLRNSTEGVGLISPPPHHDIYSIEDLAQLIHDLKNSNPKARISVKLVSEVGVGVIAAGVAKAKADHIVVSGHDGGTGAAAWTGIKHAGLPWELGIAETHQTLVLNNLRSRVRLQTDGQMKTGKDVTVAFLLGAEEVAFATAPLIALGCIMMRKCHLNTCPVGIATQDPELRKKFFGKPEYVVNFMFMLAEEVRINMAAMGFRTVEEMIGRADMLQGRSNLNAKQALLDMSKLLVSSQQIARASPLSLVRPDEPVIMTKQINQDHQLDKALDVKIIQRAKNALDLMRPVRIEERVLNTNRTVGTMLSYEVSKRYGGKGLPDGTIKIILRGHAGQSLGAFLAPGIDIEVIGDTNDYLGKGLSGGTVVVRPDPAFRGKAHDNMACGNVCFYGATRGKAFVRGLAGERFCVRNSGAVVVCEGVGDHGLEYMTGGRVTILGETGKNFGAGMSGGIAFVFDPANAFPARVNLELVSLEQLTAVDAYSLRLDLEEHVQRTDSEVARKILSDWQNAVQHFVKVYPKDLRDIIVSSSNDKNFRLPHWFPKAPDSSIPVVEAEESARSANLALYSSLPGGAAAALSARSIVPEPASATSAESKKEIADMEDMTGAGCATAPSAKKTSKKAVIIKPNETAAPTRAAPPQEVDPSKDVVMRRDGTKGKINKLRGFIEYDRNPEPYREPIDRIADWREINLPPDARPHSERRLQAARCMDCGTPFCQTHDGCPINNLIPEFNALVFRDQWKEALDRLLLTNNFPEFTGRVCPAPCEGSCVAGLVDKPVTIKNIEYAIVDRGFKEGWIVPNPPAVRSGRSVAVVGSGPAGLACADQLNKEGHLVTVFERADRIGGLLMYGIPNMKLEKATVDRRVDLMRAEGVKFVTGANVGVDPKYEIPELRKSFDALVFTVGATTPRDLSIPGRNLKGIYFAMDFLVKNTQALLDNKRGAVRAQDVISARNKHVVVIGGGDTGADCIGTSIRHGCLSVVNFELMDKPPPERSTETPWPMWPRMLRVDYAHEEAIAKFGGDPRTYSILTKEFIGDDQGNVCGIRTVLVKWEGRSFKEVAGTEKIVPADLVCLSMGFLGPDLKDITKQLPMDTDARSNIKAKHGDYRTSQEGVFAAGDCRRGQSLVVWAINEGRGAAEQVHKFLKTRFPSNI